MKVEETHLTQKQLQQEVQSLGYNVVSCGSCEDVFIHKTPTEEIQCPHYDSVGEPCNFPDLY